MIYYFSGTGNSHFVASQLAKMLDSKLYSITVEIEIMPETDCDMVGFVFPVYSWGVPPNVLSFINSIPDTFWHDVKVSQKSVWCVMTCGDEVALAPEMFVKALSKKGVAVESVWSVIMPNNYVLLPGFDVDSRELELRKLKDAPARISEIASGILQHRATIDVVRGGSAWIKTKGVYPLFKRWGIFPRKWHSTYACVGCGICARSCPYKNIKMEEGHPVWGSNCCSCLACYHSCPRHSVEYGSITRKKGQYWLERVEKEIGKVQ